MPKETLPEARKPQGGASGRCSRPLSVWTDTADAIRSALNDEPMTAMQIAGHLGALKAAGVGYWEPLDEAEWTAALRVWRSALSSIPARFAGEAFEYWAATHNRRPSPGDIANRARSQIDEARQRLRKTPAPAAGAVFDPREPSVEEIQRRREMIERLTAEFPMLRRMD